MYVLWYRMTQLFLENMYILNLTFYQAKLNPGSLVLLFGFGFSSYKLTDSKAVM